MAWQGVGPSRAAVRCAGACQLSCAPPVGSQLPSGAQGFTWGLEHGSPPWLQSWPHGPAQGLFLKPNPSSPCIPASTWDGAGAAHLYLEMIPAPLVGRTAPARSAASAFP